MKKLALASVITLLLSGCGGGSDSSTQQAQTPSRVTGTIERVDNENKTIRVNGHDFNYNSAVYHGNELSATALQANMLVSIAPNTRAGMLVEMEPTLVGQITLGSAGKFSINGIELTFANLSSDIDSGDWVMVSSLPTATSGYKVLSVVEFEASDVPDQIEIEGPVSQLTESSFKLGAAITINYTSHELEPGVTLRDGMFVEVTALPSDTTTFDAESIEVEDYDDLADDNEIEGVITWVNADKSQFELNRRGQFVINSNTRFEDGSRNNLIAGTVIELTATNNIAIEIEFDDNDNDSDWHQQDFEYCGSISNISHDNEGMLTGFEIKSQAITVDALTFFDDGMTAASLTDGQLIEVEGLISGSQKLAREIELEDDQYCDQD